MRFLRYPGGKTKQLDFLKDYLPEKNAIIGNYYEPFVGGGSVFLSIKPKQAILSDLNSELIELYKGIRNYPDKVWHIFCSFEEGQKAYYEIRDSNYFDKPMAYRAARTLYLNRTCFKGMWRHSPSGNFNVGYGGEERRWSITYENIKELSKVLKAAKLLVSDFETILNKIEDSDFIFLDPPYKPGQKELKESHYTYSRFTFEDQVRLSNILKDISSKKNVKWIMTNSSHLDICNLYSNFDIVKIPKGTSERIGISTNNSQEVLILNL